jgi:MOSC domain-containing protein YiiM
MNTTGRIEAIYIAATHGEQPHAVESAAGEAGMGLVGDRNFGDPDPGSCNITLIEAERFERQRDELGLDLNPGDSRRQVLVRGLDLGELIGRRFLVGDLECEGEERCEPCSHLVQMVGTQVVLKGLLHSGLRARILSSGTIRVGDEVRLSSEIPDQPPATLVVNGDT